MMKTPGIYVHLPFCAVRCAYCDFPLTTRLSLADAYYEALFKEVELHPTEKQADTLYFGGGTPSRTPAQILRSLRRKFDLQRDSEITLEANPDDMSGATLREWKALGINRLSIGVQSLEEPVLQWMLRKHSATEATDSLDSARKAGFANVNVDFILGAPSQTQEGFLRGLRQVVEFGPEHFSLYFLEVHDGTALHHQLKSGKVNLMSENIQMDCYCSAVEILKETGYQHYEVSNFARPGFESRHNMKYWTHAPYYAYGAGACSYLEPFRTKNLSSITAYIEALQNGRISYEEEIVEDKDTSTRNALIFGLRKTEGIDVLEFEQTFGVHPLSLFDGHENGYMQEGLLQVTGRRLHLTFAGLLVSNEILSSVI